ncbi:MAG: CoA transferase [Alphaproteobacteria bacterium]
MSANKLAPRALEGIRVIDITTVVAAPFGTQILGDHGADVIKVEPPKGDDSRNTGAPAYLGETSAHYANLNRNKRGIALDLSQDAGRAVLLRLLETADVLVENLKPGTLEGWGIGYDTLKGRFPRLIHCRVSGFGADGPLGGLPGYDMVAQGFCGIASLNGEPDRGPLRTGINAVDISAGLYMVAAVLLGIVERFRSGLGQSIEITLFDAALSILPPFSSNWLIGGIVPTRTGNRYPVSAPLDMYPTRDGHILVVVGNDRQFVRLCETLGQPDLATDPRFITRPSRIENIEPLTEALTALIAPHAKLDLAMALLKNGVPAGPILSVPEAFSQEQTEIREMVLSDGKGYKAAGIPIKLGRTPGRLERVPPRFGEHNREILRQAGFTDREIEALIEGRVLFEKPRPGAS